MNYQTAQNLYKKLAIVLVFSSLFMLIALPVLARRRFYPPDQLYTPSPSTRSPIRSVSSEDIEVLLKRESEYQELAAYLQDAGLQNAGLINTFKQKGFFILFAPTNKAFDDLDNETLTKLKQPQKLAKLLKYHLVIDKIPQQVTNASITTASGDTVTITARGKTCNHNSNDTCEFKVNGVIIQSQQQGIEAESIEGSNGVIIRINKVLIPPGF
ncbi:fasciclin domain-containing protein [Nostoc sp.]|uniref:fasciclin domain-containing protein n=1 Tax=Nostoc sp. TaxID=1180 RepID=UPI002FFA0AF4